MPPLQKSYGSCCEDLKHALAFTQYQPLIWVGDNGGLCMAVGYADVDDGKIAWFDQTVFFCPFCRTRLVTREELKAAEWPT